MPAARGVRTGFIGLPGVRVRPRLEEGYGEAAGDLAARYAAAVRCHDEALAELRSITDEMARIASTPAPVPLAAPEPVAEPMAEIPADSAADPAAEAASPEKARKSRSKGAEEPPTPDRPTNLRCERADSGSMFLTWDATPREGLVFGVWRSVTAHDGSAGAFQRIAMVRETGFIDADAPADAQRISYAVRALDGRRPVPGSAHLCVTLDDE